MTSNLLIPQSDPIKAPLPDKELTKAKFTILSDISLTFLASIMLSLRFKWDDSNKFGYVDGECIALNANTFESLPEEERIGLILHEVLHVALNHLFRLKDLDPGKFNHACDYVINNYLDSRGYKFPPTPCLNHDYDDLSAEQIYDLIPEPLEEDGYDIIFSNEENKDGDNTRDGKALKDKVDSMLIRANTSAILAKSYGDLPGELNRYIDELLNPVLPWNQIIQEYASEYAQEDFSFAKVNRRHMPEFVLPSLYSEAVCRLAVAIDSSYSVTQEELTSFVTEAESIREMVKPISMDIISFDTEINGIWHLLPDDDISDVKIEGGGGTDLQPVFDYYNKHEPALTVLIVFSDLECYQIQEEPDYDVIWVIVNNPNATVKFGKTIHYSSKK